MQPSPTGLLAPQEKNEEPFLQISRSTGSSRILAMTERFGLWGAILLACSVLALLTLGLASLNHQLAGVPLGATGLLNSTLIPFLLGAPTLYALLTLCRRLEVTRAELARLSSIDMLTGLMNRRSILAYAEQQIRQRSAQADAGGAGNLSIALLDVDNFKAINDRYGHLSGDAVLRLLAQAARGALPSNCALGRFGGEEFAIVMPARNAETALALAETLRAAVEDESCRVDGQEIRLTVSLGVTTARQAGLEQMLSQADQALYAAKRGGRNQVQAWQPQHEGRKRAVNVISM